MYAIVQTGGRQLKVREGETVTIDDPALTPGEEFKFEKVLLYCDEQGNVKVGKPTLDNVTVSGVYAGVIKAPKLTVFKFRRRKNSKTKTGHRQHHGAVRIEKISVA